MHTVLIVEDEAIIRKGLSFLIDWVALDCSVTGLCADGQEGLEFIRENHPDIILTDVQMPIMNGIEMLNQVRGLYPFEAIILSGHEDFRYATQAIRLEVSDYILKPIGREELTAALDRALEKLDQRKSLSRMPTQTVALLPDRLLEISADTPRETLMDAAVGYIAENYQSPIQTADLCEALGVSKTLLNQRFKQDTGHTVNSFINRYRITRALEHMDRGQLRISEIAEAVGYSDYKYFFEVFRKYMGCSPKEYVQNTQNQG